MSVTTKSQRRAGRALANRRTDSFDQVAADFHRPDSWYAPHFFYFFTGDVESADLHGQAAAVCEKGFNPGYFFMVQHPGYWMDDIWFDAIRKTLETTRDAGAYACYTPGDPCVPGRAMREFNPELAPLSLRWSIVDLRDGDSTDVDGCFVAVAAKRTGGDDQPVISSATLQIVEGDEGGRWTSPAGEWRVYKFTKYWMFEPAGIEVNFLDKRVGDAWIAVEHEKYAARVGEFMGTTMPGAFIDLEGDYGTKLAWSDDLAAEYATRNARDIRLWLPLLVDEDVEGLWGKARWDYFKAVSVVYLESFIIPLDKWLGKHDMYMTCHFWEENLVAQAMRTGDFFAAQRSYSLPGTDSLFMGALTPRYFKETQTVSEFEGRQLMCELGGVSGWHVSAADLKNETNCAIAWGVTHVAPMAIYTNRDVRRVLYPPDWYDWNPCWRHFEQYADYCRRSSFVNSQGNVAADVILLCPMDSVWALLGDGLFDADVEWKEQIVDQQTGVGDPACMVDSRHGDDINVIERAYTNAMSDLTDAHIEYLVLDCDYLRGLTLAADGTLTRDGYSFRTIVLPPLKMLPLDVAEKIADFAKRGGHVVILGSLPSGSTEHGWQDARMVDLMDIVRGADHAVVAVNGIAAIMQQGCASLTPHISFVDGKFALHQQHRRIDGVDFYWLVNSLNETRECTLRLNGASGGATRWDCETGAKTPIPVVVTDEGVVFSWTFAPYEAFWLAVDPMGVPVACPAASDTSEVQVDDQWRVWFDPSGQPNPAQHVIAAPSELHGIGCVRPLASWLEWGLRSFTGFIDYETSFTLDRVSGQMTLDLGIVKHVAEVSVNGRPVGARIWAPYSFDITDAVQPGRNTVHVRVGNLIVNAMTQYEGYPWKWHGVPTDEQLDSGLFGPVVIRNEP
ncbi:MAG TPA: glycosyl hydrolase [Capsulimonadaceae bacterium]|jgi:hypothetical protein